MLINGQETQLIVDLSRGEDDPKTPITLSFAEMKAANIVGCWARAVNGVSPDLTYPIFRAAALAAGMPFGAFGTLYPGDSNAQARAFIGVVDNNPAPELPHVIDWEVPGATWRMADTWLANVETHYPGKEIINYSRAEFLKRALPNRYLEPAKYNRFAKLVVWQAHYGVLQPDPLPAGFTRILWQYTDRAPRKMFSSSGESLQLDMSYFFGTLDEFKTRFGLLPAETNPPVTPPPPPAGLIGTTVTFTFSDGHSETVSHP